MYSCVERSSMRCVVHVACGVWFSTYCISCNAILGCIIYECMRAYSVPSLSNSSSEWLILWCWHLSGISSFPHLNDWSFGVGISLESLPLGAGAGWMPRGSVVTGLGSLRVGYIYIYIYIHTYFLQTSLDHVNRRRPHEALHLSLHQKERVMPFSHSAPTSESMHLPFGRTSW